MKANRGESWTRLAALVIAVAAVAAVAGCQGSQDKAPPAPSAQADTTPTTQPSGDVVATYAGHTLTSGQVIREFERLPAPSRAYLSAPERKRQFIEQMVMNELLFDEGKRDGLDKDPDIDRQVVDLRRRLVVQRVMRKYQTPPTISDEQARAYYDQNPDLYSTTQVHAFHILVKDEETAKQIAAELKSDPKKFGDLARDKSTDTSSARKGGDLGTFGQGRMVPEFERAAFKLKPNEISDPVKTQYGWHIIMVTERKEGERKPFEQLKEQIRASLRNQALQDQVQGHMDALKQSANLKIDEAALAKVQPPQPGAGETIPMQAPGH